MKTRTIPKRVIGYSDRAIIIEHNGKSQLVGLGVPKKMNLEELVGKMVIITHMVRDDREDLKNEIIAPVFMGVNELLTKLLKEMDK
ncbi:hypothetical protein [Bacillus phage vB_BanS-Thrax3]|nr:hypothetical protein [Bacillus phage vB_BanS-Thrax3]